MNTNLYREAQRYLVGGVNSPVRSFKMVNLPPLFAKKAKGKYLYDYEGNKYTDYCLSWGAIILGHNHPIPKKELHKALQKGTSFGFCHLYETRLARLIQQAFPSMEKMRFVNSGTEAVMSAIRVARGFTKRKFIVKFDGCYHGHSDSLLVKSGSGLSEIKESSSEGVPTEVISQTLSLPFNNTEKLTEIFKKHGKEIACVILEPIPANMGVILPHETFLFTIEKLCKEYETLLIFDEVITGFRVALGGAQELFGIQPDLTILGKIIGGGLPIGCFGGKEEIMKHLAPEGNVYQAGTLSGNPLSMRAGFSVLHFLLRYPSIYTSMRELLKDFQKEWQRKKLPYTLSVFSTMFSVFYTSKEVDNFHDAQQQDIQAFQKIYKKLLENGILFPPSCFEGCFLSMKHKAKDLEKIIEIFCDNVKNIL
ncbi:glutamate-1-semialdehyde 2,1-aminomutase [Thermospira aquatica]|uniref:Glutamate-1-semialdehyde 2,1-aminomutase n=1 Tax=Thermospira aquatica TaxID=2828656 RepID=A0AAX3BAF8_9SPIR|nr:glutamate-1-semialdehyde 2,1-aminomutase [Thermospira aquatica]URA09220.1 glutamate-1-semialdehyde 2,1-aminomutase [Thermospira aquatica]